MSSNFDDDTSEIFTPQKAKEIVSDFAEMADLSAFDGAPEKLSRLLDRIEEIEEVPPHMDQYTVEQLRQAAETVRYFKLRNRSPYTGLLDDLDLYFQETGVYDDDDDASDDDQD